MLIETAFKIKIIKIRFSLQKENQVITDNRHSVVY